MTTCDGVTALGDCDKKAKYVLTAPHSHKSHRLWRTRTAYYACGLHLAQVVKRLLPKWGYVGVGEQT